MQTAIKQLYAYSLCLGNERTHNLLANHRDHRMNYQYWLAFFGAAP